MRLTHFSYNEFGWELKEMMTLQPVNLLVGKNAVGKSKTIQSLGKVIAYLLQQKEPSEYEGFGVSLAFEDKGERFSYNFIYSNGEVIQEELFTLHEKYLSRNKETAILHDTHINPPANKLILHVRRDTVQYPYIEKIMLWAEQACGLSFNEMDMAGDNNTFSYILGQQKDLYSLVKSMSQDALEHIVSQARSLDYLLTKIEPLSVGTLKKVTFQEQDVTDILIDKSLSKGMFRALYLLIYMEHLSEQEHPSLLLVDDLCEGLDYDRSTKLGKLVFNFCLEHNIQLIASSNDTFLMDVVNLKYWNILQREGSAVTSINAQNSPELFNDFSFTGLSNFDFFSSDYIARNSQKKTEENE